MKNKQGEPKFKVGDVIVSRETREHNQNTSRKSSKHNDTKKRRYEC